MRGRGAGTERRNPLEGVLRTLSAHVRPWPKVHLPTLFRPSALSDELARNSRWYWGKGRGRFDAERDSIPLR